MFLKEWLVNGYQGSILEQALEFIDDDELVEVTPQSIRIPQEIADRNGSQALQPLCR